MLLGVLLIKTLPSKCISQIKLDINKILKKIYKGMRVEENEKRSRRGWHKSELQGKGQSREMK